MAAQESWWQTCLSHFSPAVPPLPETSRERTCFAVRNSRRPEAHFRTSGAALRTAWNHSGETTGRRSHFPGGTQKTIKEKNNEVKNMDAHRRSDSTRRAGDLCSTGRTG